MTYYEIESGEKYLGRYTDEHEARMKAKFYSEALNDFVAVKKVISEYIIVYPEISEE